MNQVSNVAESFVRMFPNTFKTRCWKPAADIYRDESGALIKLELAGVNYKDIEVSTDGDSLIVLGSRREQLLPHGHRPYMEEIDYSPFRREFEFSFKVDAENVYTHYIDGILYVYIKKAISS